jgi:hypothetical protein
VPLKHGVTENELCLPVMESCTRLQTAGRNGTVVSRSRKKRDFL